MHDPIFRQSPVEPIRPVALLRAKPARIEIARQAILSDSA
jgi:hypothetical protein